ncbi:MAG: ABC transporter [Deltaproteobacteria bacterium HGW-Deltaproteobacteria-11]|nr:MAG: ABC transporter [Deltaproteobacteria bacterium HGW-Deltaproteobacteria-11]
MRIRKMGFIPRTYRNLDRYRQILAILFKYGFDSMLNRLNLGSYFESGLQMISRNRRERIEGLTDYERLRMAFEELGPTFIKMGQILSTRSDLIPDDLVRKMTKLQDNVPPFPFSQVREIVEQELCAPLDALFAHFDDTPLAAASIGQVHRARLVTGEEVIIKIQRPGIRKVIEVDLEILFHLATLMEKNIEEAEIYRPTKIVDEFARSIEKEINYKIEAQHAERFARQFAGNEAIFIPRIFNETTTERVLTMEYVDGVKASDIDLLEQAGLDRQLIAARGADVTFEQIFKYGFFHADPHPGNICILPGNVICYLDFGMMGYIDKRSMETFADIIIGYVRRDEAAIADAVMRIVEWDDPPDRRALESDIASFVDLYLYKPLKDMHMGEILQEFLDMFARHRLRLPPDIFFMIKAMTEVEGLGLMLDPDFNMVEKVEPFIKDLQMQRIHPKKLMGDFLASSTLLKGVPFELYDLLKQFKSGKVKIGIDHQGLEPLIFGVERSSNRISFALIIAALIIGSSLIMMTRPGPTLFELPLLGLLGYALAGVLGLWLLMWIRRSGRL